MAGYEADPPPPNKIDPTIEELLNSSDLHSGKFYYPLELFYFVPFLRRLVLPLQPKDSHAHMNLDSSEQGVHFNYAFEAAVRRTRYEFDKAVASLSPGDEALFTGKAT